VESLSWWAFCGVLPGHVVLAPKVLVRALEHEEMCGSRSQVVCEQSRKAETAAILRLRQPSCAQLHYVCLDGRLSTLLACFCA